MTDRTRIFICYRKRGADGRENNAADQLYRFLKEDDPTHDVWMDEGLDAGLLWEKTIYEHLLASDVLILAIGNGTSQSEWVRRELSIAMAFGIQIVPVGLSISEPQLHQELAALGLTGIHYKRPFNMASQTARAIVSELAPAIARGRDNTRAGGYQLLGKISQRVQPPPRPAARANLSAASRQLEIGARQLTLHIASGDIFRLSNFEILVNSENDYMQMARIFDMASISSNIRHRGSSTGKGYLEDTIQLEIEKAMLGRPRPLPPGTALVTSSGGPSSSLFRNNRTSHIVHVAAVQAVLAEHRIAPLRSEGQIRECVAAAFASVQDISEKRGIISPEGSPQRELQEAAASGFAPKRVVLPLFGTGRGGQTVGEIGPVVLDAIVDFFGGPLYEERHMPLTDIHVSVFLEDDVATMSDLLSKMALKPHVL